MNNDEFISTTELAKILNVSRVTVFRKIKAGDIKAIKIGRNFVIRKSDLPHILGGEARMIDKENIREAVKKTVEEYGETLRLLGRE